MNIPTSLAYDMAHMLAGGVLVMSFAMLYQRRLVGVINVYVMQALLLAAAAAWQAIVQHAPHLWVTALIALAVKAILVPVAISAIVRRLRIDRAVEPTVGVGVAMVLGVALVSLSVVLVLPVTEGAAAITREDLAFALSVVLLGLLMMITRRNAITQVIGFMSVENGLILAAVGVKGMPLIVEMSVALSVMVAFIIFGIFFFRIREQFDSLDTAELEQHRGEAS